MACKKVQTDAANVKAKVGSSRGPGTPMGVFGIWRECRKIDNIKSEWFPIAFPDKKIAAAWLAVVAEMSAKASTYSLTRVSTFDRPPDFFSRITAQNRWPSADLRG